MNRASPGAIRKYSVTIQGHRTSLSLEPQFWQGLKDAAAREASKQAIIAGMDPDIVGRFVVEGIRK